MTPRRNSFMKEKTQNVEPASIFEIGFPMSRHNRSARSWLLILPVVFLSVGAVSGCSLSPSSAPSGPAPYVLVTQVIDLGPIPTNPDILGRDGGYSTLFQGFSVWLYGDTFIAKADVQNRTLLSDSWSFAADLNAQSGLSGFQERLDSTGAPTMILPESTAEQ